MCFNMEKWKKWKNEWMLNQTVSDLSWIPGELVNPVSLISGYICWSFSVILDLLIGIQSMYLLHNYHICYSEKKNVSIDCKMSNPLENIERLEMVEFLIHLYLQQFSIFT